MRIRPVTNVRFGGCYRLDYILNQYPNTRCIFVNNMYIAVINPPKNIDRVHTLAMQVESKVPLWKQSMQMQMGRRPQTSVSSLQSFYFQNVSQELQHFNSYYVYECF